MPKFGKCSWCNAMHQAPFGSRCKYSADAKQYCRDNNIPEDQYLQHVDYCGMPTIAATDDISVKLDSDESLQNVGATGTDLSQDKVDQLLRRNQDQKQTVDLLISKMKDLTSLVQSPTQVQVTPQVPGHQTGAQAGAKVGMPVVLTTHPPTVTQPPVVMGPPGATTQSPPTGRQPGITATSGTLTGQLPQQFSHNIQSGNQQSTSTMGPTPAPADLINGQLTTTLDRLSLAIDPSIEKNQGMVLRPEFYVQHLDKNIPLKNVDHSKLSLNSLLYGMCRVLKHLMLNGGDTGSYVNHMLYITKLASLGEYVDATFINYDRCVVDAVISQEIKIFIPGYPLATSLNFHASNLICNQADRVNTQSFRGRGRGHGRGSQYNNKKSTVPEGFPDNICFEFNYKSCEGCTRSHICRICNAAHKAINCPKRCDKDSQ